MRLLEKVFNKHCTLKGNTQSAWDRIQKNSPRFTTVISKTLEVLTQLVDTNGSMEQKINSFGGDYKSFGSDYKRHAGVSNLAGYTIFNLDRGCRIVVGDEFVDGKIEIKGYGKDAYNPQ